MNKKMLLIEDIKLVWVDQEKAYQHLQRPGQKRLMKVYDPHGAKRRLKVTFEMVEGKLFTNSRKEQVCVGMTEKAVQALGWPVEVMEKVENEIVQLRKSSFQLEQERSRLSRKVTELLADIGTFQTMGFWQRIRFLFGRTHWK